MVNYENDLKHLFQPTTDPNNPLEKKAYYVDNIFFSVLSDTTFRDDITKLDKYLADITNVNIYQQAFVDVRKYTNMNIPGEYFESSGQYAEPSRLTTFVDDSYEYDLSIDISKSTSLSGENFQAIIREVTSTSNITDEVTKDHVKFRNFIFDMAEDVTRPFMVRAKDMMVTLAREFNDTRECIYEPIIYLGKMKNAKFGYLLTELRSKCIESFKELFEKKVLSNPDDIKDLKMGGFRSKLYYELRTTMISKVDIKNLYNSPDSNLRLFFKKYIVELYIKACYPVIHLIYMQAMLEWKTKIGDYVNVRVIVLAMAYYVFYTLTQLKIMDASIDTPNNRMTVQQEQTLKVLLQYIITYVENNTKADINAVNGNEEIKRIIIELHEMSSEVVNGNSSIQIIKKQIQDNQLSMRNILFNIEVKRKDFKWAYAEFIIAICILLLFVIVNTILLIFSLSNVVYGLSALFSIATILYLTTMAMLQMMKTK